MKILIICTWFPPDGGIGAVRPYMFAKYLSMRGHEVTVVHSGEFDRYGFVDNSSYDVVYPFRVLTAYAKRNDSCNTNSFIKTANIYSELRSLQFSNFGRWIKKVFRIAVFPAQSIKLFIRGSRGKKKIRELAGEEFDLVFSTFGELENIFLGNFAKVFLKCKHIQDFRDPLVNKRYKGIIWNSIMLPIEKHAVQKADLCTTVSEATTRQMECYRTGTKCVTLYNGYDRSKYKSNDFFVRKNQLVLCYTGTIYIDQKDAAVPLFRSIKDLIVQGKIDRQSIRFVYAGGSGKVWKTMLNGMDLEEIYEDHGYLSRDKAEQLQRESDIYLVLSWNRKENQGVISGKFYEGIRAEKPILAVVGGNLPNSELYQMNEKYHYGYCFEEARGSEEEKKLKQYLLDAYHQKMEIGKIGYHQNPQLEEDFCYENLAKKLEILCYELIGEKGAQEEEKNEG